MKLRDGEMWSAFDEADLFLITTNGTITRDGRLVMGAGIALEARERFPGVDKVLAQAIKEEGRYQPNRRAWIYGFLPGKKLGMFQVKYEWSGKGVMDLILISTSQLQMYCVDHPEKQIHLNFPGIGNGKLSQDEVLPYISQLPDSVTVWRK